MRSFRQRLACIAMTWLCCQISSLTAAPFSLLAQAPGQTDAVTCTCVHTGAGQCPMHHAPAKKRGCECRSASDPGAVTLVSLLGPAAVLVSASSAFAPPPINQFPTFPITRFSTRTTPPDGPPPRA